MNNSNPVDELRCVILGFFILGYSLAGMNECVQSVFYWFNFLYFLILNNIYNISINWIKYFLSLYLKNLKNEFNKNIFNFINFQL